MQVAGLLDPWVERADKDARNSVPLALGRELPNLERTGRVAANQNRLGPSLALDEEVGAEEGGVRAHGRPIENGPPGAAVVFGHRLENHGRRQAGGDISNRPRRQAAS